MQGANSSIMKDVDSYSVKGCDIESLDIHSIDPKR